MKMDLEPYLELQKTLDAHILKLERMHVQSMQCRKGCYSCCESLTVFPVEFYAIKAKVDITKLPQKKLKHRFGKSCRFLVNGECAIYEQRPIICRTQGLPLLYENHTGNVHELSVCKLNFVNSKLNSFHENNALLMAPYNSRLFLTNKNFVEQNPELRLGITQRLPLNSL